MTKKKKVNTKTTDEPARGKVELVCTGLTYSSDDPKKKKPLCSWTRVVDGALSTDSGEHGLIWAKLKGSPGHVYEVEYSAWSDAQKILYPTTVGYRRAWPNDVERLDWELKAKTVTTELEQRRHQESAERATLLRETLAPISALYGRLLPDARRGLLAAVMFEIQTGAHR